MNKKLFCINSAVKSVLVKLFQKYSWSVAIADHGWDSPSVWVGFFQSNCSGKTLGHDGMQFENGLESIER